MRQLMCSAFLLGLIALGMPDASACECGSKGTPHKELRKAKAVFVGEVIEVKGGVNNEPYLVKFNVEGYWKGVKEPSITILSPGGLCGIIFSVNQKWLVYAYGDELWTDTCRRTTQLMNAAEDLQALGKAKTPKTASTTSSLLFSSRCSTARVEENKEWRQR